MRHYGGPFCDHLACFKSKSRHLAPPVDTQVARRAVVTVLRVDSNGLIWKSGFGQRDMRCQRTCAGAVKEGKHRSEEHTSELQSLMRISYAVFCLKKKKTNKKRHFTK